MKVFREHVAPLIALACAAVVFIGAALDLPDEARPERAPAVKVR